MPVTGGLQHLKIAILELIPWLREHIVRIREAARTLQLFHRLIQDRERLCDGIVLRIRRGLVNVDDRSGHRALSAVISATSVDTRSAVRLWPRFVVFRCRQCDGQLTEDDFSSTCGLRGEQIAGRR